MGELAAKLWDRFIDRVLEEATGHKFNYRGYCEHCRACCLDVCEEYKLKGKDTRKCPKQEAVDCAVVVVTEPSNGTC